MKSYEPKLISAISATNNSGILKYPVHIGKRVSLDRSSKIIYKPPYS